MRRDVYRSSLGFFSGGLRRERAVKPRNVRVPGLRVQVPLGGRQLRVTHPRLKGSVSTSRTTSEPSEWRRSWKRSGRSPAASWARRSRRRSAEGSRWSPSVLQKTRSSAPVNHGRSARRASSAAGGRSEERRVGEERGYRGVAGE